MRRTLRRALLFMGALLIVGIAVICLAESKLGADSITVLYMGLKSGFGLAYSISAYLYNGIVIALATIFARRYVGIGTLAYSFTIGFFIALAEWAYGRIGIRPDGIAGQVLLFAFGQVLLAIGMSIIIRLDLGVNCLDALILKLHDRYRISYRSLRIAFDLIITAAGWALGGVVGAGTAVSVLSLGILIQFFTGTLRRIEM